MKLVEPGVSGSGGVTGLLAMSALRKSPYESLIRLLAPLVLSGDGSTDPKAPNVLVRLWGLLNRISFSSEQVNNRQFLKSFIDGSGMLLEHKIRSFLLSDTHSTNNLDDMIGQDLKGLALKAMADGVTNRSVSTEFISRFIDSLELFQLVNVSRLEDHGQLFFTIPLQLDEQFGFGELFIKLPKKGEDEQSDKDGDQVLRVSFLLHMSSLGPVRADVSVFQKAIRVCFVVSQEEIQALFNNSKELLKLQLERHGFNLQEITCRLQEADLLAQSSLVEELLDFDEHEVNLVV